MTDIVAFLPNDAFKAIIRDTPLVSIDLILCDDDNRVLVGMRQNEPARGHWFVPGGRIRKGETLKAAFARLLLGETGLVADIDDAEFMGVYEHHYASNTFEDPEFGTHYVVLGYRLRIGAKTISADSQHSHMTWMSEDALRTAPDVHQYTKNYFAR